MKDTRRKEFGSRGWKRPLEKNIKKGGVNVSDPKSCFQTGSARQACAKCGKYPTLVHIPTMHVGYYCRKCCPACSGRNKKQGKA
jgi:hypothetical protein